MRLQLNFMVRTMHARGDMLLAEAVVEPRGRVAPAPYLHASHGATQSSPTHTQFLIINQKEEEENEEEGKERGKEEEEENELFP